MTYGQLSRARGIDGSDVTTENMYTGVHGESGGVMVGSMGVREFRAAVSSVIDAGEPVEVTRHGQAVGWFIPMPPPRRERRETVRAAVSAVKSLADLSETEVEELVDEFERMRARGRRSDRS